jgi:hypothetical protein
MMKNFVYVEGSIGFVVVEKVEDLAVSKLG